MQRNAATWPRRNPELETIVRDALIRNSAYAPGSVIFPSSSSKDDFALFKIQRKLLGDDIRQHYRSFYGIPLALGEIPTFTETRIEFQVLDSDQWAQTVALLRFTPIEPPLLGTLLSVPAISNPRVLLYH